MNDEKTRIEEAWRRISEGRHAAVLGLVIGEPPASLGLRVVRVSCDVPASTLGPLIEARQKIEKILGGSPALFDQARTKVVWGLRRRLLGDALPSDGADGAIVATFNRLAAQEGRRSALVLDCVDAADEATLDALRQMVSRVGWLELPLLLVFRERDPSGRSAALIDSLRAAFGTEAVIEAQGAPPEVREAEGRASDHGVAALTPDVLRVVRAGALIGSGFEAELVAALLRLDTLDVIEHLQTAADAGLPIDDRGEGRFHFPEPLVAALRASLLPSLARAWHRRLAEILTGESGGAEPARPSASAPAADPPIAKPSIAKPSIATPPIATPSVAAPSVAAPSVAAPSVAAPSVAAPPTSTDRVSTIPITAVVPIESVEAEPPDVDSNEVGMPSNSTDIPADTASAASSAAAGSPSSLQYSDIYDRSASAPAPSAPSAPSTPREDSFDEAMAPDPAATPDHRSFTPPNTMRDGPSSEPALGPPMPMSSASKDEARAAGHLTAAGEIEAAAERYAMAVRKAMTVGAYAQAFMHGKRALALLDELPNAPRRRKMRVRILADLGRVQWIGAGPDVPFTLADALTTLDAARALLEASDPPSLRAELAEVIAGVCYDIGDMRSLERALDELTSASRALLAAGDAAGAARLLNDQAAVYVRMGDPVRATHLLGESTKVFEQMGPNDPIAMIELAETDHLFARIPLHVAARPGREQDALSMGLDHAIAAERTYKKIGAERELGRVWETMGRLELAKGRLDRAAERLAAAMQIQRSIGDILGLARTTAVLSEVFAASGRYREAASVLGDSIALNMDKGSPIGLAFNRRSLDALAKIALPRGAPRGLFEQVAARLAQAEAAIGRVKLPGERD